MKKLFLILIPILCWFLSGCSEEMKEDRDDKFMISLFNTASDDIWFNIDLSSIDSINWKEQRYYIKRDSLFRLNLYITSDFQRFIFLYDSVEIYRASLVTDYRSTSPPKDLPIILIKGKGLRESFPNGEFRVDYMEKAKINKRAYKKAEKYLEKRGLLVDK